MSHIDLSTLESSNSEDEGRSRKKPNWRNGKQPAAAAPAPASQAAARASQAEARRSSHPAAAQRGQERGARKSLGGQAVVGQGGEAGLHHVASYWTSEHACETLLGSTLNSADLIPYEQSTRVVRSPRFPECRKGSGAAHSLRHNQGQRTGMITCLGRHAQ